MHLYWCSVNLWLNNFKLTRRKLKMTGCENPFFSQYLHISNLPLVLFFLYIYFQFFKCSMWLEISSNKKRKEKNLTCLTINYLCTTSLLAICHKRKLTFASFVTIILSWWVILWRVLWGLRMDWMVYSWSGYLSHIWEPKAWFFVVIRMVFLSVFFFFAWSCCSDSSRLILFFVFPIVWWVSRIQPLLAFIDVWFVIVSVQYIYFIFLLRSNNSEKVLAAMVTTMTIAILESDDISLEILIPILASVRKENEVIIIFPYM